VPGGNGIRVDTAQYAEGVIPPYYDSLIAKLIAHGVDRAEAMAKMERALSQFIVQGIDTSIPLHQEDLSGFAGFRAGEFDTGFMERFLALVSRSGGAVGVGRDFIAIDFLIRPRKSGSGGRSAGSGVSRAITLRRLVICTVALLRALDFLKS
jgi:hypothetical protein